MGRNVAHPPHSPKGQVGNLAPGCLGQVGRGFADDLDAPDDGILFLRIGAKTGDGRVFDVRGYETRCLQYVVQAASWSVSIHADRRG
jgi:hypothetical protein